MSKSKKTQSTEAKAKKAERKPKTEKGDLRTVAMRVSEEDFQLLHKAAGPRNLANFMRTTLLTAAAQKAVAK